MGTFIGHVIPGSGFILWGAWWYGHTVYRLTRPERLAGGESTMPTHYPPTEVQESTTHPIPWPISTYFTRLEPAVKIGVPLAGAIGELWWGNWKLDDSSVINFQHATMYLGFLFAGIVDLLEMKGLTPRISGHIALIAAFTLEGVLFMGHPTPRPGNTRPRDLGVDYVLPGAGVAAGVALPLPYDERDKIVRPDSARHVVLADRIHALLRHVRPIGSRELDASNSLLHMALYADRHPHVRSVLRGAVCSTAFTTPRSSKRVS